MTKRGSESAFQTLVERHLGLVWSVAQRQVQDAALAEEIAQAVFVLLARKARHLSRRTVLGGWLFQTTRFVAARALRSRQRRQQREQEAVVMHDITQPDPHWDRIAPELDEAMEGLGRSDRQAILLRYYEGCSHREVAAALGVSEEAAKKRVQRGLEKLRDRLGPGAGTVSAATLGSLMTVHAVSAAPGGLAASVSAAVTGAGVAGSSGVMLLAQEALSAWRLARLKSLGLLGGTAGVIAWLVVTQWPAVSPSTSPNLSSPASEPERTTEVAQVIPDPRPTAPPVGTAPASDEADAGQSALFLQVLTWGTDAPVAGAGLALNIVTHAGEWVQRYDLRTDETGWATVPYPADAERLDVGVWSQGWAARYATFTPQKQDPIPVLYTLRTQPVQDAIGGWVRDEQGRPVPGANIRMHFSNSGDAASRERPRERDGFIRASVVAVTDAAGHWTSSVVPRAGHPGFGFRVEHPEYGETWVKGLRSSTEQAGREFTPEEEALWAGRLETVLQPGVVLTGRVVDEQGRPVADAALAHSPRSSREVEVRTDTEGRFEFPLQAASNFDFVVTADGFAPVYVLKELDVGMAPLEITLKPGAVLRLRVEDEHGVPVPDAEVILEQWGSHRGKLDWRARTDGNGRLEWAEAPWDEVLELCSRKEGWCYTRYIEIKADGQEHVITLVPALEVNGLARDAVTGLPVRELKAIPGHGEGEHRWERLDTRRGSHGQFRVEFTENKKPWRILLEAEGYEPWISGPVEAGFRGLLEARMQPDR